MLTVEEYLERKAEFKNEFYRRRDVRQVRAVTGGTAAFRCGSPLC
jgi:hypothetical protein